MIPIKTEEIEKMRLACRTASEILDRVSEIIRPGISTKEVDEAAADIMQEAGVKSAFLGYRLGHRVFPGNICISLNDEIVHGIGSQRRIQYGDIVKLDIGVIQEAGSGIPRQRCRSGSLTSAPNVAAGDGEGAGTRDCNGSCEGGRLGDISAEIEEEAMRNRLQCRARVCRARRGTKTARRTADSELWKAWERART